METLVKILGYVLISSPLVAVFIVRWKEDGLKSAIIEMAGAFIIVAVVFLGIFLIIYV